MATILHSVFLFPLAAENLNEILFKKKEIQNKLL